MFGRCITYWLAAFACLFCVTAVRAEVIIAPKIGRHKEFVRIAFNWPEAVNFEYKIVNGGVQIRFFERSELLLDNVAKVFPGSFYKSQAEDTSLFIKYSGNRQVKVNAYGHVVYVDVYSKAKDSADAKNHKTPKDSQKNIPKKDAPLISPALSSNPLFANLLKKISDYLDVKVDAGVVLINNSDLLIKNPKAPVCVYKHNNVWVVVVQDTKLPVLSEEVKQRFAPKLTSIKGGYVLEISADVFEDVCVSKVEEGWLLKKNKLLQNKSALSRFVASDNGTLKTSRNGLMAPLQFNGVSVFCALNASVMYPLAFDLTDGGVFSTRLGLALKTSAKNLELSESQIVLHDQNSVLDAFDKKAVVLFPKLSTTPLNYQKQEFLKRALSESAGFDAKLDLVKFYLSNLLFEEAWAELLVLKDSAVPQEYKQEFVVLKFATLALIDSPSEYNFRNLYHSVALSDLGADVLSWYFLCAALVDVSIMPRLFVPNILQVVDEWPPQLKHIVLLRLADVLYKQKASVDFEKVLGLIKAEALSGVDLYLYKYLFWLSKFEKNRGQHIDELHRLMRGVNYSPLFARMVIEVEPLNWSKSADLEYVNRFLYILPLLAGHKIHPKALKYSMKYYIHRQDFVSVLDMADTIRREYPDDYDATTQRQVANILAGYISTGRYEDLGLIQTLRILTAFADALPLNEKYGAFVLSLTQKLNAIGMGAESIALIEKYLGSNKPGFDIAQHFELLRFLLKMCLNSNMESKALALIDMIKSRVKLSELDAKKILVLEAEVALNQGESKKALDLLTPNSTLEGLKLRADILWSQKRWGDFAETVEDMLSQHLVHMADDSVKEAYIVQWVAALVLELETYPEKKQKNLGVIKKIIDRYGQFVVKHKRLLSELAYTPNNSSFQKLGRDLVELELGEVDRLESLFNSLREVE